HGHVVQILGGPIDDAMNLVEIDGFSAAVALRNLESLGLVHIGLKPHVSVGRMAGHRVRSDPWWSGGGCRPSPGTRRGSGPTRAEPVRSAIRGWAWSTTC